jgi:hypothetical protein
MNRLQTTIIRREEQHYISYENEKRKTIGKPQEEESFKANQLPKDKFSPQSKIKQIKL